MKLVNTELSTSPFIFKYTDNVFIYPHSLPVPLKGQAPGLDLCSVTCYFSKQLPSWLSFRFLKQPAVCVMIFWLPFMAHSSSLFPPLFEISLGEICQRLPVASGTIKNKWPCIFEWNSYSLVI